MQNDIKLFEQKNPLYLWWRERYLVFFVVDVISILIEKDYQNARKYWNKLSERLRNESDNQTLFSGYDKK